MRIFNLIILFFLTTSIYGQIKLADIESSECIDITSCSDKMNLSFSADTLIVETSSVHNCAGIYEPDVKRESQFLKLNFRNYEIDSTFLDSNGKPMHLVVDCICRYNIKWKIIGLNDTANITVGINKLYFDTESSKWKRQVKR